MHWLYVDQSHLQPPHKIQLPPMKKQTNPKLNACTKAPAKILKTNSVVVPATVGVLGLHFKTMIHMHIFLDNLHRVKILPNPLPSH